MVSKCHLSPFMYKTAKCLPGILLDAETDWKQLNYNLYGTVLLFLHTVSVFNLFLWKPLRLFMK